MNEEKWGSDIPFNEDDMKMYRARELAEDIEECYQEYGVSVKIRKKGYNPCYGDGFKLEVKLKGGTRIEQIEKLAPTVRVKLHLQNLHFITEDGIPYLVTFTSSGTSLNKDLKQIIESSEYKSAFGEMQIVHPVGVDKDGKVMICDLAEYPHAMVSGTTRSGKSTALKCLLVSLSKYAPDKMNLLIADRGAELSRFDNLPHLSYPIIYKPEILAYVFLLLKDEMERRNVLRREDEQSFSRLPYIVCVIDEFPWFIDEINSNRRIAKVVKIINDILRFGRNSKIHLVLSVHDPKDDIVIIEKGDIPVGLVFQTVNARKSMNVLGEAGAEKLSGKGDMSFRYRGKAYHLQGVYMDDDEIDSEVRNIELHSSAFESSEGEYGFSISDEDIQSKVKAFESIDVPLSSEETNSNDERERKFAYTVIWVLSQTSVSINSIQKGCSVGNSYAQDFFGRLLYSYGVIGDEAEKGRRKVCPQSIEDVPKELKEFLSRYGISDDKIEEAISKRKGE